MASGTDELDLSCVTGACSSCKRTGLKAEDFFEYDLRAFLHAKRSVRTTDAREEVHAATKKIEVAGANLFCRQCTERQRATAAASDAVWNDDSEAIIGSKQARHADAATLAHAVEQQQEDVADSWEDD